MAEKAYVDQPTSDIEPLNPPHRLLMAPGPTNVDPRVLTAMSKPTVGQFDPYMFKAMGEVQKMLRTIFKTDNERTMVVDGIALRHRSGVRIGDRTGRPGAGLLRGALRHAAQGDCGALRR